MSTKLTKNQARQFVDFTHGANRTLTWAQNTVDVMREQGWTIEPPPEPRYQTVTTQGGAHTVVDTRAGGDAVAVFYSTPAWMAEARHPDAEAAAQAEADRLNRGDA